ncbi:MAG: YdiU family protein [Alphaproteobacteria bacterium]|nr:YdiU family protein [Alphaproteobacteria bacterium]
MISFPFDNSYARLPEHFFTRQAPVPVASPGLLRLNRALAAELGLDADALSGAEGAAIFAGNLVPEGAEPLAQAYSGHQFGNFSPRLGDGRAILLGEIITPDGLRFDMQLKGSGRTEWSRGGDGRAAIAPMLREYIISEAMAAFGIPTTRSLAVATTGEYVFREDALPGAVLTRTAARHIRVGTFQYFAARGDTDAVRTLAEYARARHCPDAEGPLGLFRHVVGAQARLVAQWLLVGFIHGVMNTDNCAISGETIDYGPCAFLDEYHPETVFSSIDHGGRYAYGNQPRIVQWNLARFAETLLPMFDADEQRAVEFAQEALQAFPAQFEAAYQAGLARKLGLADPAPELARDFLALLAEQRADFTTSFRALAAAADDPSRDAPGFAEWSARWRAARPDAALIRASNPAFIPRNHLVEEALTAATAGDTRPLDALLDVLSRPFDDQPDRSRHASPPRCEERVLQTFCGT